ncbi:uncharacterized protein LOC143857694 [Tasmannia lanceolata]|uniref:uncharacterized protein LOC143857694 n=1 Tax=Tasmannia lanceolata TaxID=3420 RepID=UPI004064493D
MESTAMMRSCISPLPHSSLSLRTNNLDVVFFSRSTNPSSSLSLSNLTSQGTNPISSLSLSNLRSRYSSLGSKKCYRFITRSSPDGVAEQSGEEIPIEKRFAAFPTVFDINQIREILPHRFPFLLVDRIIEYKAGVTAVGIKNVTINDNFFPGHFPERPIMPGVLMVEALAQVGGIVMLQPEVGGCRDNFFFAGIDKVRFRKPVIAGDTLVLRMTLVKLQKRFGVAKMEGKAYVGGEVVCDGEFLMATGSSE